MWFPVTDQVIVPWPAVWSFSAEPSAEPEFATPDTPIVLPEKVPVCADGPVVLTIRMPGPTALRKVLFVMLIVVLPLVPLLESVSPPPPVAMPGWLLLKVLPLMTRSRARLLLWL